MKDITEYIFWFVAVFWGLYLRDFNHGALQTVIDTIIALASALTLFRYWRNYNAKRR
jgi:hypothetical protein